MSKATSIIFGTFTVFAASEQDYKSLQRSFTAKGLLFTSNLGPEDGKSPQEVKLEAEYSQLSGLSRFRVTKEQKTEIESGEKTRMDFLKYAVTSLKRQQAAETKKVEPKAKKQKVEMVEAAGVAVEA